MGTVFRNTGLAVILAGLLLGLPGAPSAYAQAPVAGGGAGPPPPKLSAPQLEELVGRIALYPDDLLVIVLPSATTPLELVKAQRFLDKHKKDPKLKPDPTLPEPVRNLLNYPEVVKMMSEDLDWTENLGQAVATQQKDVMQAIQTFRRKVQAAGNLKTDDKQIIVQEKEVIKIVPADPQVIYVPQYQPSTVVVYQPAPVYAYYPVPYPVYYYPYPPGHAFATGLFFGATTAWAFSWHHSEIEANVNINRTDTININRNNPELQQKANEARQRAQQPATQQARQQAQQRPGAQPTTQQASPGQRGAGAGQPSGQSWQSGQRSGQAQPGAQPAQFGGRESGGQGGAFGGMGSGVETSQMSQRGGESRSAMGGAGGWSRPAGSSGGGSRSGGGARRR